MGGEGELEGWEGKNGRGGEGLVGMGGAELVGIGVAMDGSIRV